MNKEEKKHKLNLIVPIIIIHIYNPPHELNSRKDSNNLQAFTSPPTPSNTLGDGIIYLITAQSYTAPSTAGTY